MLRGKPRLYSYCIPVDDGAAPNPYWGVCTLAICKPAIRRTAQVGDWVVGTGSARSPIGDIKQCVVYAMRVSEVLRMEEYDLYTRTELQEKIPDWENEDYRRKVGDSIYDFSGGKPRLRKSAHSKKYMDRDLRGENVLLSNHFYYFGNQPAELPSHLLGIIKKGQGHRSGSNDQYINQFIEWIEKVEVNKLYGEPQIHLLEDGCGCDDECECGCGCEELD